MAIRTNETKVWIALFSLFFEWEFCEFQSFLMADSAWNVQRRQFNQSIFLLPFQDRMVSLAVRSTNKCEEINYEAAWSDLKFKAPFHLFACRCHQKVQKPNRCSLIHVFSPICIQTNSNLCGDSNFLFSTASKRTQK